MNTKQVPEVRTPSCRAALQECMDILMNAPIGICTATPEGRFLDMNHAMARMFGYDSPQEMITAIQDIGKQLYADPKERAAVMRLLEKNGEVVNHERRHINKDGSIVWASANIRALRDDAGNILLYQAFFTDITARKLAEEILRKSEERYRSIVKVSDIGVWECEYPSGNTWLNPEYFELLGYDPETFATPDGRYTITEAWISLIHPDDREKATRNFADYLAYGSIGMYENLFRMRHSDGHYVWILARGQTLRNEDGSLGDLTVGTHIDITKLKQAEEQLQDTLERLQKAVDTTIHVMVAAVDARDPYTAGHQTRVAQIAEAIAMEMGLPQGQIDGIRTAGTIHDIGKLSIPAEILSKPAKLSELEFALVKEHAREGWKILKDVESPWPLAEIVFQHHERMDGSGYPRGLKGDEILLEARIISVADEVEAMATHRPYRASLGLDAALADLQKNRGTLYDAEVVDACLRLFREKGYTLEGI